MRNYKLKTVVSVLLLFAGILLTGSQAFAYGVCGNDIWQRDPFGEAANLFNFRSYEQCDNGGKNAPGAACTNECKITKERYDNGIIENEGNYHEQCDTGIFEGIDACIDGKLTTSTQYIPYCGNGVLDPGESCDDGDEPGGCPSGRCNEEANPEPDYAQCETVPLCGDGRIDHHVGEQCDEGKDNGKPGSGCSALCVKTSNPEFRKSTDDVVFWEANSGLMDARFNIFGKLTTGLINPVGSTPINPATSDKFSVSHRGQVISIKQDPGKQYAGVVLSNRKIDEAPVSTARFVLSAYDKNKPWDNDAIGLVFGIKRGDERNSNANYLMLSWRSHYDGKDLRWGTWSHVEPTNCPEPVRYGPRGLHLYHIKGVPRYDELWQMKNCANSGTITEIETRYTSYTGGVSYAWNKRVNPAYFLNTYYANDLSIVPVRNQRLQILAEYVPRDGVDDQGQPVKAGLKVWINYQLALDLDGSVLGSDWPTDGEWGFYFLGMDNFVADFRGYENQITLGEYSDNDPLASLNEKSGQYKGIPLKTHCGRCGNGVIDKFADGTMEACDDGNTANNDGCNDDCTSTGTKEGWVCDTSKTTTVCFKGEIVSPAEGAHVASTTPNVIGTYQGKPGAVKVKFFNNSGKLVCSGFAKFKKENDGWDWHGETNRPLSGEWEFDFEKECKDSNGQPVTLSDTKTYTIRAYMGASEDAINNNGKVAELLPRTFTVDLSVPTLTIDKPEGNPAAVNPDSDENNGKLTVGGTVTSHDGKKPRVSIELKNSSDAPVNLGTDKNPVDATLTGNGPTYNYDHEFDVDTTNLPVGTYTIVVTATNEQGVATREERKVIIDRKSYLTIQNLKPEDNSFVPLQNDNTITVSGNVKEKNTTPSPDGSPLKVTVVVKDSADNEETTDIPVNSDGTFSGNVALPKGSKGPYEIEVTASDKAGNKSKTTTIRGINTFPTVTVTEPGNGKSTDKANPTIKGTSTPGVYEMTATVCKIDRETRQCVGQEIVVPTVRRDPATGDWEYTVPEGLGEEGKVTPYKTTVTVKFEDSKGNKRTEKFVSYFNVDLRDLTENELTRPVFIQPAQANSNGGTSAKDPVDAKGGVIEANNDDSVTVVVAVPIQDPTNHKNVIQDGDYAVIKITQGSKTVTVKGPYIKETKEGAETGEWVLEKTIPLVTEQGEKIIVGEDVVLETYSVTPTDKHSNSRFMKGKLVLPSQGFVAGGCASVPGNPANDNLPILLLVGLGVVAIRRRRK